MSNSHQRDEEFSGLHSSDNASKLEPSPNSFQEDEGFSSLRRSNNAWKPTQRREVCAVLGDEGVSRPSASDSPSKLEPSPNSIQEDEGFSSLRRSNNAWKPPQRRGVCAVLGDEGVSRPSASDSPSKLEPSPNSIQEDEGLSSLRRSNNAWKPPQRKEVCEVSEAKPCGKKKVRFRYPHWEFITYSIEEGYESFEQ